MGARSSLANPFNGSCPPAITDGGSSDGAVDRLLGTAYDQVRHVATHIEHVKHVSAHLAEIFRVSVSAAAIDAVVGDLPVLESIAEDLPTLLGVPALALLGEALSSTAPLADQAAHEHGIAANRLATALGVRQAIAAQVGGLSVTDPQFNANGNGIVDDTTALQAAIDTAAASGAALRWPSNKRFRFTQLTVPANAIWQGTAKLRYSGLLTAPDQTPIVIGADAIIDRILMTSPGTGETNHYSIEIGARACVSRIEVIADAQKANSCVTCKGDGEQIGYLKTRNVDRPFAFNNAGGGPRTRGGYLGFLDAENYVRGFNAQFTDDWVLGGHNLRGKSPNASVTPGHNGFLIADTDGWQLGDGTVADSGEHAIRLAGTATGCKNARIGHQTVLRAGGCAFKINPNSAAPCRNIAVASIHGIDVGVGTPSGGNRELARISHSRNIRIGALIADLDQAADHANYMLQLNDVDGLHIDVVGGDAHAGINIDETSDADGVTTFAGPVRNVFIDRWFGKILNFGTGLRINMPTQSIGGIYVRGIDLTGFTTNLLSFTGGAPTITGDVFLQGRVFGTVLPNWSSVPADTRIQVDLSQGFRRFYGHPNNLDIQTNGFQLAPNQGFSLADQKPTGIDIQNRNLAAALNAYGNGLEVSRLGTARRGAAFVPKQTGAAANNMGWAWLCGANTTATDALLEKMVLKHSGVLQLLGVPTYADNAAATAGGLENGDLYKTATGEVRVKV